MFVSKIIITICFHVLFLNFNKTYLNEFHTHFILESYDALRIITTISFEIFLNLLMQFLISTSRCNS